MKYFILFLFITLSCTSLFAFEDGMASWYGGKFQGRLTANGEIFDTNKKTAAHKTLPFNTIVRVTNLDNNKTVEVRINDRGPFIEGRIIDLSRAAAEEIDMVGSGVARVRVEILGITKDTIEQNPENNSENSNLQEIIPVDETKIHYNIQLGAFSMPGNARDLISRLESSGFSVCTEKTEAGIIRVLLCHIEEEELEDIKNSLSEMGFDNYLLKTVYSK